ncbi:MAG: nucleotide exchange factor GrpE [Nanoarchaeota archaeon]
MEQEKMTEKEYLEKLARLQAEFENFRRRTETEKRENASNSNANLILQLLEVLDNFEIAIKYSADPGIKLVYSQLYKILERQGLKQIKTDGKFNPNIHEAIIKEEGETYGKILEEIKKGYMLNDKLIRASKVRITILKENKK